MFRGDNFTRPKFKSLAGVFLIALFVWGGSQLSNFFAYLVALLSMLMIVVAVQMESIWPRKRKQENTIVFAIFWGCMVGAIFPFLVNVFLEGGVEALYEVFTSEP